MKRPMAYGAAIAAAYSAGFVTPRAPDAPDWKTAHVLNVHDGDSFTAAVDLGYATTIVEDFRLMGIDTPELKGETMAAAMRSRDFVISQIDGKPILVAEHGREKFGRWLAEVQVGGKDLSRELLRRKLGVSYWGGKKE